MGALGSDRGLYFGTESGLPGVHPQQAILITQPAWQMMVWSDGIECHALDDWGEALLSRPAIARWVEGARRSPDGLPRGQRTTGSPAALLREFCELFAPSRACLMAGALTFDAHRLAGTGGHPAQLGVLWGAGRYLEQDACGAWFHVDVSIAHPSPTTVDDGMQPPMGAIAPQPALATRVVREEESGFTRAQSQACVDPSDDLPPGAYADKVRLAINAIRTSGLMSLTLSQSYRRRVACKPIEAFGRLRRANPAPACFFVNDGAGLQLLGASPDLQLRVEGRTVRSAPVCGTVERRPGPEGLAASIEELLSNPVDGAALTVCTDALRIDLAPWCEPGSLARARPRLPMAMATVVHAVDVIEGRLRPGVHAWDLVAATAAPVMVTGTPRQRALAAIADIETSPRGWYGGQIVRIDCDGDATSGTILRAAAVRDSVAEVRAGGDLLIDSDPDREEAESRLKTRSLWRAFGLEPSPAGLPLPIGHRFDAAHSSGDPPPTYALDAGAHPGHAASSADTPRADPVWLDTTGDPLGLALRDCLAGIGIRFAAQPDGAIMVTSAVPEAARVWPPGADSSRVIAIGAAALAMLAATGVRGVESAIPNARVVRGRSTPGAPWPVDGDEFDCALYLSLGPDRVASSRGDVASLHAAVGDRYCIPSPPAVPLIPASAALHWSTWIEDSIGSPLAMSHRSKAWVALLFRPDSLASAPQAAGVLAHALAVLTHR